MQLTHLHLANFKCFEHTDIDFAPITLLTGANSSGKTAIIHAILGALQSGEFPFNFSPNGDYVNMGNYKRMVKDGDVTKNIKVNMSIDFSCIGNRKLETEWCFDKETNMLKMYMLSIDNRDAKDTVFLNKDNNHTILIRPIDKWSTNLIPDLDKGIFRTKGMTYDIITEGDYITELRIDNFQAKWWIEKTFPYEPLHELHDILSDTSEVLNSLAYLSSHRLPPQDYYYETTKSNLKVKADGAGFADQILQWQTQRDPRYKELVKIVKDLALAKDLKAKRNSNGTYELQIKPNNGGSPLSNLTDVGFGISQLLPIIVADLQLGNESLLIISQPETHLHPSIQAAFADYLVRQIRETKKRYIVETHSEYIINRLRLAIVKEELTEQELSTYFLQNDGQKTETFRLSFHKNGQIINAPRGFFETYMLDIMNIALAAVE